MKCDLCGGEMCVEKRDMKFSTIKFRCKSCGREIEMDWVRVASKPKSAYISAVIQALTKESGKVYISAVGARREVMLDILTTIKDIVDVEETLIYQIDKKAAEFGFILKRKGGSEDE